MKKILIANRGEIVLRVIKAARELGIQTVAVYSDVDKDAVHTRAADEAVNIGTPPPPFSYLSIENIIKAVNESGADAVHPGYGFLSENADFAQAVVNNGTTWIGPSPEVLRNIESKSYCRSLGKKVNVPITPGTVGSVKSADEIRALFKELGAPLLVKLDKGGGGKGIQPIYREEDIEAIFESSQSIGKAAFGSGDCYIEKRILNPRHIEVQFLGDMYGNYITLGERECSVQRRYQKVVEEAPSSIVTPEERKNLAQWAISIAREMGYINAGTVEFLRADDGTFYFMEVNARIQVEHPVTEMVTGIDLVKSQLRIASNEKLDIVQDDIQINGHAIEARIYAEDPETFMPSPGTISMVVLPEEKNGIRIDHALEEGMRVSPFYDPMLAKAIAWGENRDAAVERLEGLLGELVIGGVKTTIPLGQLILKSEPFKQGTFTTDSMNDILPGAKESK